MGRASGERGQTSISTPCGPAVPALRALRGSAAVLAALRAAVLERRAYTEADALALRLQGSFNEAYQPLGYLIADFGDSGEAQGYERSLDMRDGIASVRYEVGGSLYEREALASAPDGAFVMHLRASGTGKLNVTLELASPHPSRRDRGRRRHYLAGRQGARARRPPLLGRRAGRRLRRRLRLALCRRLGAQG